MSYESDKKSRHTQDSINFNTTKTTDTDYTSTIDHSPITLRLANSLYEYNMNALTHNILTIMENYKSEEIEAIIKEMKMIADR